MINTSECLELAKKCQTRKEFREKRSHYYYAKKFNVIKECYDIIDNIFLKRFIKVVSSCKTQSEFLNKYPELTYFYYKNRDHLKIKFIKQKFSTPQLICREILEKILHTTCEYNTRKILTGGRELDIFCNQYNIACEYNSSFWHKDTYIKDKEKKHECSQNNILLIIITEKNNKHNRLVDTINDIKLQFKNHLSTLNSWCNTTITESDIDNIDVNIDKIYNQCYNTDSIIQLINSCKTYSQFRKEYNSIYQFLFRTNQQHLLEDIKSRDHKHMTKNEYFEYILNDCEKYSNFVKHKTYSFAYARGYTKELKKCFT